MKNFDDCSSCGGKVSEKLVQKACWWGGELIAIVNNVPAGVCEQCGEKYYEAKIVKEIEKLVQDQEFPDKVEIPLADFKKIA